MKAICVVAAFLIAPLLFAQEDENSEWQIMPSMSVVKFFPGEDIRSFNGFYSPLYPPVEPATYPSFIPAYRDHGYSGTGLSFSARCFSDDIRPLALTFGAGITWYYMPEHTYAIPAFSQSGVGYILNRQDFTAFPVSVGVQAVFPYPSREKLMVFVGAEGNIHFISGNLAMNQQAKAGYTVLGGFAVKFLEFGIRYTAFSDVKNLGAHFGLRFKSFGI